MSQKNSQKIQYAFDDRVPVLSKWLFGLQYMVPNIISLLFVVLVMQQGHILSREANNVLSITMIIMAFITWAQSLRFGRLGAGMLLPPSIAPPYLAPCILAIKTGGLSLVFGMTLVAGLLQTSLSFVIKYITRFVPIEIAYLVLLMIGFELGVLGIHMYAELGMLGGQHAHSFLYYFVMYLPMLMILLFDQLFGAFFKSYGIAISVVVGYAVIYCTGFMNHAHLHLIKVSSWFLVPHLNMGHHSFSAHYLIVFLLAAIICVIKIVGSVPALEGVQPKASDKVNYTRTAQANFIDGMGTLLGGAFGSMGMNASSSGLALSLSKGVTSRFVSRPISILLLICAFIPKIGFLLLYIPQAIMAAVLIDLGTALIVSSANKLCHSLKVFKMELVIGISLCIGLSYSTYPQIFKALPNVTKLLFGSSIALAMIIAVILNLIFSRAQKNAKNR